MPPALPRLSTMTCWLQASVSFWASSRESVSLGPPGTNGAMKRIDLLGYSAPASAAVTLDAANDRTAETNSATACFMDSSWFGVLRGWSISYREPVCRESASGRAGCPTGPIKINGLNRSFHGADSATACSPGDSLDKLAPPTPRE